MRFSRRLRCAAPTFEFEEATLYPALHQLEKRPLKSQWRTIWIAVAHQAATAKLSLTSKGRKAAQECERQWHLTGACECIAEEKVR
jgi:hypothetical protein